MSYLVGGAKGANYITYILTLTLLVPKMINICHQYRARPTCTFVQSDKVLCIILLADYLDVPKMIMESSKRWIIPFKKFGMVSVNTLSRLMVKISG